MIRTIMLKYITLPITCIYLLLLTMEIVKALPEPFSLYPISTVLVPFVWFAVALPAVCALLYIDIYLALPRRTYSFYQKYKITNALFKRDIEEVLH